MQSNYQLMIELRHWYYIENSLENQLKTGAFFLDLTAAPDTVWHTSSLAKFSKYLPHWCTKSVELLFRHCHFHVDMGDCTVSGGDKQMVWRKVQLLNSMFFYHVTNDIL